MQHIFLPIYILKAFVSFFFVCLVLDAHPLLSSFQLMLLEHIVMCRLIMGSKSAAIQEVSQPIFQARFPFFYSHLYLCVSFTVIYDSLR